MWSAIVAQVTAGVAETDLTGRFVVVNERYCDMVGYAEAELSHMRMQDITHPEDLPRNLELFQELVRTGADFKIEKRYVRKDGALVWVNNSVSGVKDSNGKLSNIVAVSIDISERKRAEEVGARLAAIVESSDDAIVSKDLDGITLSWNRGAERLFGYAAEEVIGQPVAILIPPDRHDEEPGILERIRRGARVDHYETVRRRKDGSLVEISLTVSPVTNAEGRVVGASQIARDITERRRAQEQQNLLLQEMSHRVRNLFALASSVVTLSARSASTPQGMADAVRERLGALARAHDLTLPDLARGTERTDTATTLAALLRAIVSPYLEWERQDGQRVSVSGPDVPIRNSTVTSLALLLHELAANSAKYGALSSPAGHVDVRWSLEENELLLAWQEQGGPPLDRPPEGEGFGSRLARETVERQLGGQLSRDWRPEGLFMRLSVPLGSLAT